MEMLLLELSLWLSCAVVVALHFLEGDPFSIPSRWGDSAIFSKYSYDYLDKEKIILVARCSNYV